MRSHPRISILLFVVFSGLGTACGDDALVPSDKCADWRQATSSAKEVYVESQRQASNPSNRLTKADIRTLDTYCGDLSNQVGQRLTLGRIVQLRPEAG